MSLGWFALTALHNKEYLQHTNKNINRIEQLLGDIRYYDEVLTMSAYMAASTGDEKWVARYKEASAQLDLAIGELGSIPSVVDTEHFISQNVAANDALLAMESRAMELGSVADFEGGKRILVSEHYQRQKANYADALVQLSRSYESAARNEYAFQHGVAETTLYASLILIPLICGVWFLVIRYNSRWQSALAEKNQDLQIANEELLLAKELADEANQAKTWFLSRMSHELRTPLNAMIGFGSFLEDSELDEGQRKDVQQINRCSQHLLELVNDVLDVSKFEIGSQVVSYETVDVREVFAEAIDILQPVAARNQVSLALAPAKKTHAIADRRRLKQIALNLLSNAIKYNKKGGSATVCIDTVNEAVRVAVRDTGMGMRPETLKRLFVPFDRMEASRQGIEGTGLGLVLTKNMIESMGGSISVESEADRGSVFTIELVASHVVAQALESDTPAHSGSSTRRILVIEDNPLNQQLLQSLFQNDEKVRLSVAVRGADGIRLARDNMPSVILLDINLPDMSGKEVLRALKSDPITGAIPVIVVTARTAPNEPMELMRDGAFSFVQKPIIISKLLEAVQSALEARPSAA